jgi:hypothetical protein
VEDEMGRACSANGKRRNSYKLLVGMPKGKKLLRRLRRRWADNIMMDLGEIECSVMDWIHLAQDANQGRALVNTIVSARVQSNVAQEEVSREGLSSIELGNLV